MKLVYTGGIFVAEMEEAFPSQQEPAVALTDMAANIGPNNIADSQNIKVDTLLNCAYPRDLFVPHHQTYSGPTMIVDNGQYCGGGIYNVNFLPAVNWANITTEGPVVVQAHLYRPAGYQYFNCQATDETQANACSLFAVTDDHQAWPGFYAFITRNVWHHIDGSSATPANWEIQFVCSGTYYSIRAGASAFVVIRASTDGIDWKTIKGDLKTGQNPLAIIGNARPESNAETTFVRVFALNGKLQVAIGGQVNPVIIAIPGQPAYPTVSRVTVTADGFTQFDWHVHPMKFFAGAGDSGDMSSYWVSNAVQLGFVPSDPADVSFIVNTLDGRANLDDGGQMQENQGTLVINADIGGAIVQYQVVMNNPIAGTYNGVNWANQTLAVAKVAVRTKGRFTVNAYNPTPVIPQEVRENIVFDPNSLAIRHTLEFTLSNWYGIDALNLRYPPLRGYGNMGVSFRMGWEHMPSPDNHPAGWQHFYGFANRYVFTRPNASQAFLTVCCTDQMKQLADSMIAAPPDLDLANHYAAIAFLAMSAGITPLQFRADSPLSFDQFVMTTNGKTLREDPYSPIDFYAFSPDDHSAATPENPNAGGYGLPAGNGLRPWTPRDRTMSVLDLMQYIRKATGYLLYFDAYGFLRYEPWIPPDASQPRRIFNEFATSSSGFPGGDINEMFNLQLTNSTENTRNQIILIGIDAYGTDWSPIVEKREAEASIYTPPGTTPLANHIGYKAAMAWVDARFANTDFAGRAADNTFKYLSLPEYTVNLATWLQPDLFPMDVIWVNDPKSNSLGVAFYIMSVTNTMSVLGSNIVLQTNIGGKFLI